MGQRNIHSILNLCDVFEIEQKRGIPFTLPLPVKALPNDALLEAETQDGETQPQALIEETETVVNAGDRPEGPWYTTNRKLFLN